MCPGYVELARQEGAKVECGGERLVLEGECAGGWYLSPAVVTGCEDSMRFVKEEIFGSLAACLVFDTETGGFVNPSVIDLGWILADADGEPLVSYERLWKLPAGERIDRRALKAHGIIG